jgi:hypothetical protein
MRRVPLCLLALLAAALPGCDGLLFAELQVPSLHATLPSQSFPASDTSDRNDWCDPSVAFNDPPCIQTTLDYDIGGMVPILTDPSVTYDLRLTDVAIHLSAAQAGTDLTGVRSAAISVLTNPDDPASAVVVASYVRPAGTVPAASIGVTGNANLDLGPYLRGGALRVRAQLVIDRPTPAFLADVAAGFSLEVKLDWGSLL